MSFTEELIDLAIREDIGDGDHSADSCIPKSATGKAQLLVKDNGILAGKEIAQLVFHKIDPSIEFEPLMEDGDEISKGDIAFYVSGNSRNILKGERLALNLMQRMCAIATKTKQYVDLVSPHGTKVLDTRKTTPGLREVEKYAVKVGGGVNHRFGLYDMVMIKDNHIDYAGGIRTAISNTQKYLKERNKDLKIEVEARNLQEVEEIIEVGGIDRIMLDNFSYKDLQTAVDMIGDNFETEASGGITLDTAEEYAKCGVNYISVGALTHTVINFDLSLKAI